MKKVHDDHVGPAEKDSQKITIEAHELTKNFGSHVAVDHITFSISRGEVFGFLGANGAGKTTAMRILCGLLEPTGGMGKVAGFDISTQADRIRTRIGYMSQRFSLYADFTIQENLKLFGAIYGLRNRLLQERIDKMVAFLSMETIMSRTTGSLPWGWQQRLSLACANLHEPEVLFLDEPTGSVDPVSRRMFWDLIIALSHEGRTIFVTTHHMDEAEYCDRISIMIDGRIAVIGSPRFLKQSTGAATLHEAFVMTVGHAAKVQP